jgi:hypothetical protein
MTEQLAAVSVDLTGVVSTALICVTFVVIFWIKNRNGD